VAINMYKKARMYDQMIRLVSQYRKDNLAQVGGQPAPLSYDCCFPCTRLPSAWLAIAQHSLRTASHHCVPVAAELLSLDLSSMCEILCKAWHVLIQPCPPAHPSGPCAGGHCS
jgi:hypothetical protein